MTYAIETDDLGKTYGDVKAVHHVDLRVKEGEIYAFLGLNGAGKTTTIRMLLGMIKPTTGSAHVLQTRVRLGSSKPWAGVGYLVEIPHAYPELSVRENLEVAGRLHPGIATGAVGRVIEQLRLGEYSERRAGNLSQGNAQRLGLAKALLHDPKLLILDEPANGLDPAGIVEIRELLQTLCRENGVTVFLASHILAEVSKLAHRIAIIHEGRLLQELDSNELWRRRRRWLLVQAADLEAARSALVAAGWAVTALPNGYIELDDAEAVEHSDQVSRLLVQAGTPPIQLRIEEEDLEQYFLRLVGTDGGGHNGGGQNGGGHGGQPTPA